MPKKRQPRAIWNNTRIRVLVRDGYQCTRCTVPLTVRSAHIDHRRSGKRAGNGMENLRSLCRRCHVLRADKRHRGMIAAALRDGIIGPDWRTQIWDDADDS